MPHEHRTRWQFPLAGILGLVALCAFGFRWPALSVLLVPATAVWISHRVANGRPVRIINRIAVPATWLAALLVSWEHPGDEYGMLIVGLLPAIWIVPFVENHFREMLPLFLAAGVVPMTLLGWLMDRLRVQLRYWFPVCVLATVLLTINMLHSYPSYAKAISKNGSLEAYVSAAANLSLYGTALASLLITPVARWIRAARLPRRLLTMGTQRLE